MAAALNQINLNLILVLMTMKTIRSLIAAVGLSVGLLGTASAWWQESYPVRTKITFDTTPTGFSLSAPQTDVVLPIRLHSGNFDFSSAAPDGSDLQVIGADDVSPLPFEVEVFDSLNELALLWVKVPKVDIASEKNIVHVYAGSKSPASRSAIKPWPNTGALIFHFHEAGESLLDAASGSRQAARMQSEPAGLLAGASRFDGNAVKFSLSEGMNFSMSSGSAASMWIKPSSSGAGEGLLVLGDINVRRDADQLLVKLGEKTVINAGKLPADKWAHIALLVNSTQIIVFLDGQEVGRTTTAKPVTNITEVVLAEGFRGLMDEVQILNHPADSVWVALSYASQGAGNGLVKSQRETQGDQGSGGASPGYLGILLDNLTVDAWAVIIVCMLMLAVAVWVMLTKALMVSAVGKANQKFIVKFREDFQGRALHAASDLDGSTLHRLYKVGEAEVAKRLGNGDATLKPSSFEAIRATLDAAQVRENQILNARMVLLTIAISGGPFLGLLGTVVGVMITFAAIAAAGDVNVNAIAPGIAAALLATVAGLGVAIPALFGYNWLASQIKNISADMQIFVDEYVTRAAELHGSN